MPVYNICDQRTHDNNPWCDAVFEVTGEDDIEALTLPRDFKNYTEWFSNTSVYYAICVAQKLRGRVTVYLYDVPKISTEYNKLVIVHPRLKKQPLVIDESLDKKLFLYA